MSAHVTESGHASACVTHDAVLVLELCTQDERGVHVVGHDQSAGEDLHRGGLAIGHVAVDLDDENGSPELLSGGLAAECGDLLGSCLLDV
jgi:hypothetical protein